MDWPTVAATGLGSAWLSGINLYATVLTLGLLHEGRHHLMNLANQSDGKSPDFTRAGPVTHLYETH